MVRDSATAERILSRYDIDAEIIELDVTDFERLAAVVRRVRPQATFNLAGYGVDRSERDEQTAYRVNTHLLPALCRAVASARQDGWAGQDIVHVGSALEYGDITGDLAEHSVPNPTTLYGRSKLAGTLQFRRACRRLGLRGLTARLFTVYGPGEHPGRLLPSLIDAAESGAPLELTAGLQKRDFTYVEDVADGLLRLGLARTEPGDVVNLATGKLTTVREYVEVGAAVLKIPDARLRFGALPGRPEEMAHAPVRTSHLRALTSWTPTTSIVDGIRMAAEHAKHGL